MDKEKHILEEHVQITEVTLYLDVCSKNQPFETEMYLRENKYQKIHRETQSTSQEGNKIRVLARVR